MNNNRIDILTKTLDNGQKKEFKVIDCFTCEANNRDYILYVDPVERVFNNSINVYAAYAENIEDNNVFRDVIDDSDVSIINSYLNFLSSIANDDYSFNGQN